MRRLDLRDVPRQTPGLRTLPKLRWIQRLGLAADLPPTRRVPRTPPGWASAQRGSALPVPCALCSRAPRVAGGLDCSTCVERAKSEESAK